MATKKSDSSSNKSVWLIGGIAALIAVAAIIAVASQSGGDEVVTGVEEFPALGPVMTDSGEKTAANAMGVSGFPFFVLIDAEGKVALRISGEIETDALTEQIKKALGD